jgi:hypothetical protein
MSDYESDEEPQNIELNVLLNNEETSKILHEECFKTFEKNVLSKIEHFYSDCLNDCQNQQYNILEKDKYNNKYHNASYELFLIIYKCIAKKFDVSIFDENPDLVNSIFIEKEKEVVINEPNIIKKEISKIIDWSKK